MNMQNTMMNSMQTVNNIFIWPCGEPAAALRVRHKRMERSGLKILVTGAAGQLGQDVVTELKARGLDVKGIDIADCDLTNQTDTIKLITKYQPDTVIHCAAYTAVDRAEDESGLCRRINGEATRNVAFGCRTANAAMVYISTDYIFDGQGQDCFEIDSPAAPQNIYGITKLEGENFVKEILNRYYIVRISWVFGQHGPNFVKTMLRLGKEKQMVSVVNDQIGSPTYTKDVARGLGDMVMSSQFGIYHMTNEGYCSWFEFAQAIFQEAGMDVLVNPVDSSAFKTKAKRPLNSRLSKQSLSDAGFRRLPHWKDALVRFLAEINEEKLSKR